MKRTLIILAVLLLGAGAAFAQTSVQHAINFSLTEGAIIALSDTGDLDFALTLPATPGDPPTVAPASATRYLYYTVLSNNADAYISAALNSALPGDLTLELAATVDTTTGAGTRGTGQTIDVTNVGQNIVSAIGSCYTTQGATSGAAVVYTLTSGAYTGAAVARTLTYTIAVP